MPQLDNRYVLVPEGDGAAPAVLPEGIVRAGEAAIAAERLLSPELAAACTGAERGVAATAGTGASAAAGVRAAGAVAAGERVKIAAFDFDGTSIMGNSPVLLVRYLSRRDMLSASALARIVAWGAAYKLRLPQNESWVRGLVFSAFLGRPVSRVNAFLHAFYDEVVAHRFRPQIHKLMQQHADAGHVVVCVSATFEPIIAKAMVDHPIHFGIATRMKVDERGRYLDEVDGLPVEGAEKTAALSAFADRVFGEGNWELGWAYGDHHSDRTLLAAAEHGCAVSPDRPLARTAQAQGYEVLECEKTNNRMKR